jgi:hypothetical protein
MAAGRRRASPVLGAMVESDPAQGALIAYLRSLPPLADASPDKAQ